MAATTRVNSECQHQHQRKLDDVWVCKLCGSEIVSEPTAAEDFGSIRVNGIESLKVFRNYGRTQREMTRDNIERFVKEKGYDPVREDGKDRWI